MTETEMTETEAAESRPKKCLARAIVSMALGIFGLEFSAASGIFTVYIPLMNWLMRISGDPEAEIAGLVVNITFAVCAFMFIAIGAAAAIVSMLQAKKFEQLYAAYGSKMVKTGRITSLISLILAGVMAAATVICLII